MIFLFNDRMVVLCSGRRWSIDLYISLGPAASSIVSYPDNSTRKDMLLQGCGMWYPHTVMSKSPTFASAGSETDSIDVRLSYRIVRLFSEGLYASPNKAIEELVANSFDAGARRVAVLLSSDFHNQGATIAVLDDGEGMDGVGLKQHWLIGKSDKRAISNLPMARQQIGKFGIGKLASYVLANRLTHITKKGGKYYSTSMNFRTVDDRGDEEVEPRTPIKIILRELTEDQTKQAVKDWTVTPAFKKIGRASCKTFGIERCGGFAWPVGEALRTQVVAG
jgi:hypothetical protein